MNPNPNKWIFINVCHCDGTLGLNYQYATDRAIHLRLLPQVKRFHLRSKDGLNYNNQPYDQMVGIMNKYNLVF
jgi:hypothetical protein